MATSLREALESAVSSQEAKESSIVAAPETPIVESAPVESVQPAATEVPIGETEAQRTERLRDEKGRFKEGKLEPKAESKPAAPAQAATPAAPALAPLERPKSIRKEMWPIWDKLASGIPLTAQESRQYAEDNISRENQYFKGVSTYQQEWKAAEPLLNAIAPFLPVLEQHGIKPDVWITNLGRAHHALATGDGQTKLQMFARLAQEYGVPLQALYDANFAQQYVQQTIHQPQQQPAQQQADVATLVRQELMSARTQEQIEQFEAAKDAAGQPQYPHFQTVKADMALLLDAGKAQDLKSAYDMALRLHDDLWQAQQAAKSKADEAARLESQRKAVAAAKGSVSSVKSATPASAGAAPRKGIRGVLEDAFDQHMTGRV